MKREPFKLIALYACRIPSQDPLVQPGAACHVPGARFYDTVLCSDPSMMNFEAIYPWHYPLHRSKKTITRNCYKYRIQWVSPYEYNVEGQYSGGWEVLTCSCNRKDALDILRDYRKNEPGTLFRIRKVRREVALPLGRYVKAVKA